MCKGINMQAGPSYVIDASLFHPPPFSFFVLFPELAAEVGRLPPALRSPLPALLADCLAPVFGEGDGGPVAR